MAKSPAAPLTCILAGCGGYGGFILNGLLELQDQGVIRLVAVADPAPPVPTAQHLHAHHIPVLDDYEQALDRYAPQWAVLASPIHLHASQAIATLQRGIPVLCEKPAAATHHQALAMAAAAREARQTCAIGFQWCYSEAVNTLKTDIAAGRLGQPLSLSTAVLWERSKKYYARNGWAGKWAVNGVPVGDSILSNATAHHLHFSLYLLGKPRAAAKPQALQAWVGRANDIETCDTAVVEAQVQGVTVRHCASHALAVEWPPLLQGQFSEGILSLESGSGLVFRAHNGQHIVYGDPDADPWRKLKACAQAARDGLPVSCDIACASVHLDVVERIHQQCCAADGHGAGRPPAEHIALIEGHDATTISVSGLEHQLLNCWAHGAQPPSWLTTASIRL